jgi:hypothetical protein
MFVVRKEAVYSVELQLVQEDIESLNSIRKKYKTYLETEASTKHSRFEDTYIEREEVEVLIDLLDLILP